MINYYGINKEKNFFQIWYFKQQCKNFIISFVPGIVIEKDGEKKVFINIYDNQKNIYIEYPFSDFSFRDGKIKIAKNEFSENQIKIDISSEKMKIKGKIVFSRVISLKKKHISSLKIIKSIKFTHEIISIRNYLNGILSINNNEISFCDGIGYIESIFGKKISKEGIWFQCSDKYNYSIMVSIEPINKIGMKFLSCVAFIYCNGREYKFSTNRGCRIITYNKESLIIKQGKYYLKITFDERDNINDVQNKRDEILYGKASVLFKIRKKIIFQYSSEKCSYKYNIKK